MLSHFFEAPARIHEISNSPCGMRRPLPGSNGT